MRLNDHFRDLIKAWREKIRAMTPGEHSQASARCPSLASLQRILEAPSPAEMFPEDWKHVQTCLFCQKRERFLKKEHDDQKDTSLDILAADAGLSLAEAVRYRPVSVVLTGDGYETSHLCLIRLDWESHETVYVTIAVPQELRTFRDVRVSWKTPSGLRDSFKVYIAPDRATVVARSKGHDGVTSPQNVAIAFRF